MLKKSPHQFLTVNNFDELLNTAYNENYNAICLHRNLEGNFKEIVTKLQLKENVTEVTLDDLLSLELSPKGNLARETILNDIAQLTSFGAQPSLNLLKCYARDEEFDFIATDVYSFHVDCSPIATDTFLCTYEGAASDILPNEQAIQKILIPAINAKLKEIYDETQEDFETFIKENFFDLHYEAKPNAQPINLGNGHLWKLAVDHPHQKVFPCIHRAPIEKQDEYRLLLIC